MYFKNNTHTTIMSKFIILAIMLVSIFSFAGCGSSSGNKSQETRLETPIPVSKVSSSGSVEKVASGNVKIKNIRKVKFNTKHKSIAKYEQKNKDTENENYNVASDNSGYSYLSYSFNKENAPTFYGVKVVPTDVNAILQYTFKDDKLKETLIQYGNISKDAYTNIVNNIKSTYKNPTYTSELSNGQVENWWKTKDVTLRAVYQQTGVSVFITQN